MTALAPRAQVTRRTTHRPETEAATADAEAAGACARGYLSAIPGAFDASSLDEGVVQARTEIEALTGSCSGILGSCYKRRDKRSTVRGLPEARVGSLAGALVRGS